MNYCSTYLWEKGTEQEYNPVSLLLQQVKVRKQNVLLACVCEGKNVGTYGVLESGYFTEALVEWFHRECLQLLAKKWTEEELGNCIQGEVERVIKELEQHADKKGFCSKVEFEGILLVEHRFWRFSKGEQATYLINRRFNKKHMRRLEKGIEQKQVFWMAGNLQKHLGILLCTEKVLQHIEKDQAAEILLMSGEQTEERLQKRLQELRGESIRRKEGTCEERENCAGAVYIKT